MSIGVETRSGGGLLVALLRSLSVDAHDAFGHLRKELRGVEASEALLGHEQRGRCPDVSQRIGSSKALSTSAALRKSRSESLAVVALMEHRGTALG